MSNTKKQPVKSDFDKVAAAFFESASEFVSFDEDDKMSTDVEVIEDKKSATD